MTAAQVLDVISRLPGCARQAADAVSAYTEVKMVKIAQDSEVRVSIHMDASSTTQMAKIMVQYGRPSGSSRTKFCTDTPLAGLL